MDSLRLYWWWIESGGLFAAYFFMSCVGAWVIVQWLDDLYYREKNLSYYGSEPLHGHVYSYDSLLRAFPLDIVDNYVLEPYSEHDAKASLKFLARKYGGMPMREYDKATEKKDEQLYSIRWRGRRTGAVGQGTGLFNREIAESTARQLEQASEGLLEYWIEPEN